MIVRSSLPWCDVDDFRRYRPEVLAGLLAAGSNASLTVDRLTTPFVWTLHTDKGSVPLAATEAALRQYFDRCSDSAERCLLPGHPGEVAAHTTWSSPAPVRLKAESTRYSQAVALADELTKLAPEAAAQVLALGALSPLSQAALRTICFESPLKMCVELLDVARELISAGYATVDFRGHLSARATWEFEQPQRKLERMRQAFAG